MVNKNSIPTRARRKGLTIIEMSLVLALLVALATLVLYSVGGMDNWKKGKEAGEQLRLVYIAQKTYMADHPTENVANLNATKLIPYLPNGAIAIGQVEAKDGSMKNITVNVMPPVVAGPYDPSGAADDGLWDVGKH